MRSGGRRLARGHARRKNHWGKDSTLQRRGGFSYGKRVFSYHVEVLVEVVRHVDAHRVAVALHAAGGVHRVPKEAVARALGAHHTCERGSAVDAHAEAEVLGAHDVRLLLVVPEQARVMNHVHAHAEELVGVVRVA
eukprot:1177438-Prorocentrum_minimum.AAC.1